MKAWLTDPTSIGLKVYLIIFGLLTLLCIGIQANEPAEMGDQQEVVVTKYIRWFLEKPCDRHPRKAVCVQNTQKWARWKRAPETAKLVTRISKQEGVDPLVTALVISYESSFVTKEVRGKVGERGPMQVHGICARGCDFSTYEGGLLCGVKCLARGYRQCDGSDRQALSKYQSGYCSSKALGPKKRYKRLVYIRELFKSESWSK